MACGAGLPWLALAVTIAYFVLALVSPMLIRLLISNEIKPVEQSEDADHD
jgi:putative Mg2+ transporter-C (MgtC) family protein